jgi:hypothetical protein
MLTAELQVGPMRRYYKQIYRNNSISKEKLTIIFQSKFLPLLNLATLHKYMESFHGKPTL